MIPDAAVWVQANCKPFQIHSLPSSPWFLLPYPSTEDGFMSWEQKWLLSDYTCLCAQLFLFLSLYFCVHTHTHTYSGAHTAPHTHLHTVHFICLLEFEDKLLWFGSQPAKSSVGLCRGQGVFAYLQGSGNINKPLPGHISMTEYTHSLLNTFIYLRCHQWHF